MSCRIRCFTLFEIERTNIVSRRPPVNFSETEIKDWELKRNKQCNFDTILQIVSLRGQPEDITSPTRVEVSPKEFNKFGFLYDQDEKVSVWKFDFTVDHDGVFKNEIGELGALFTDSEGVPMIKMGNENLNLDSFLCITPDLRNIYFEVIPNE